MGDCVSLTQELSLNNVMLQLVLQFHSDVLVLHYYTNNCSHKDNTGNNKYNFYFLRPLFISVVNE